MRDSHSRGAEMTPAAPSLWRVSLPTLDLRLKDEHPQHELIYICVQSFDFLSKVHYILPSCPARLSSVK